MIQENIVSQEQDQLFDHVERFIRDRVESRISKFSSDAKDFPELQALVIADLKKRMASLLPEQTEELSTIIDSATKFPERETFANGLTDQLKEFVITNKLAPALEEGNRRVNTEESGWTIIHRALAYEVQGDRLMLRMPELFLEKPRAEFPSLFLQGLRELAGKLSSDPMLAAVTNIEGEASRPNYAYLKRLQALGFEVTPDRETKTASIKIGAEKLKALFGVG